MKVARLVHKEKGTRHVKMESFTGSESVAPIKWSDSFLLGYDAMDSVHREFVDIVHALQSSPDENLARCLEAIAVHAESHFECEDRWMVESDFPARGCHIDEHAAVLASVEQVRLLLAEGNIDPCRRLGDELARWFPSHADHLDSALSHWMCKQNYGGKPVVFRRDMKFSGELAGMIDQ